VIGGGTVAEPWSQYGGQQETILTLLAVCSLSAQDLSEGMFSWKVSFSDKFTEYQELCNSV
ncbi:hypothetical protein Q5O12_27350, partial [Klebsiella pneumoniae]|uniref:hypothetical protein n=1 Tax=Klebsiella pneumoniae TaxID=573 RepID=UPI00273198EF